MNTPATSHRGRSANAPELRQAFVGKVHQLLQLGYERLAASELSQTDEPAITGLIVNAIEEVLDDPPESISPWCDHFHPCDDPPENTKGLKGKNRKRVDIRVSSSEVRPRARFRFEAKRLSAGKYNVAQYAGEGGLGCFLNGAYAADDPDCGMIGYVQSEQEEAWAQKVSDTFSNLPDNFCYSSTRGWQRLQFTDGPAFVFVSSHHRRTNQSEIVIYHTFLNFCEKMPISQSN